MKLRVVWSPDEKKHLKFKGITMTSSSTLGPLITSKCIKIPSYIYSRVFKRIDSFLGGIVKFTTVEELKEIEDEFMSEWDSRWVYVKLMLTVLLPYPTNKILSNRRLEKEVISFYREKEKIKQPRPLFYKMTKGNENKELNTDLNLPSDILAFKQLNTLLEYKWKEK